MLLNKDIKKENKPILILDRNKIINEDDLPDDLTDEEYDEWFKESWVDIVRLGYGIKRCY